MDQDQTPINDEQRRKALPAAAENVGLWVEEHVVWPAGDALAALRKLLGHGVEWLAWVVRRGLIWPLQDRGGALTGPGRALAALAAVLVIAVGVAALVGVTSDGTGEEPASSRIAAAVGAKPTETSAKQEPAVEQAEPTLKGAAPVFEPTKEEKKAASEEPVTPTVPANPDPATARIGTTGPQPADESSSAATSSTAQSPIGVDGPPAGPEAIAVAEDFAGAFVLYETGGEESKVRKAFAETATPELAKSLLRRPPRLPANVEVPKAKVVNVVAGPSHGGVYTISVSLLRVGLTSELRLDMEKQKKSWLVTNVLG